MPEKRIDAKEFQKLGYLQEVNRLLLHRLGLALEVVTEEDGSVRFGGVWDLRDDPEGMAFEEFDQIKQEFVAAELAKRLKPRVALPFCNADGVQVEPMG